MFLEIENRYTVNKTNLGLSNVMYDVRNNFIARKNSFQNSKVKINAENSFGKYP